MSEKTLIENIKSFGLKQVIHYMDKNPDENIPKILNWIENNDKDANLSSQVKIVRESIEDPESNWNLLVRSLWSDIDDSQRKKIFENFIVNASMIGSKTPSNSCK